MNGYIKINRDWINLNGATVIDINGVESTLAMLPDDEFYITVTGDRAGGEIGAYIWHGTEPTTRKTDGSQKLDFNVQAHLIKGIDDIYVKSISCPAMLNIRKVQ